jgi:hypothetical protein
MKYLLIVLNFLIVHFTFSQSPLPEYFPSGFRQVDLSVQAELGFNRRNELYLKDSLNGFEKLELDSLIKKYDESVENIWDVIGGGCSWYCGGGNYSVKSSSELRPNKEITYKAKNANDLSYKTAWIEGAPGDGIGEYLEYYFENKSPRVTKIIFSNGYLKTEALWRKNNRVKKIKFYVNGKAFGVLNLEDTKMDQIFKLGIFGQDKSGDDLVLKFEILEVYRGGSYRDTAITEIYFDGIDVH